MSNAAKVIDKLTRTYICVEAGCTTGIAAMTIAPKSIQDAHGEQFVFQCHKCGALWKQDGEPIAWPESETEPTP